MRFVARKGRAYKYPNSKFSRSIRNSPGLFLSAVTKGLERIKALPDLIRAPAAQGAGRAALAPRDVVLGFTGAPGDPPVPVPRARGSGWRGREGCSSSRRDSSPLLAPSAPAGHPGPSRQSGCGLSRLNVKFLSSPVSGGGN